MENLPPEVVIPILKRCTSDDLVNVQLYCDAWSFMLNDNGLFLKKFQKVGEEEIWRKVFPNYPRLQDTFADNLTLYRNYIKRYRFIIECATTLVQEDNPDPFLSNILNSFKRGETPLLFISDFERFIYELSFLRSHFTKFLEYAIELFGWPFCFEGYRTQFPGNHGIYWKTICDAFTRGTFPGALMFLEKYKKNIIWNTRELYKYLNEDFLRRNKEIWTYLDWSSILVKVDLSEEILEIILEVRAQNEPWYGKWPNITYITSHQHMSETFIERWFVNTCFDNDVNWNNIIRCQHISAAFKDKYEHKIKRRRNIQR